MSDQTLNTAAAVWPVAVATVLRSGRTPLLPGVLALALAACGQGSGGAPGGGGQMPPPQVGVLAVQPASVALATELPGRLEALRTAQVRARVTGVVKKRLFTEGALVKAGQSLFEIDAAPYRAALDSATATQAKAEAALAQAVATLERNRPLFAAKAISQQDWIATEAAHKAAVADVAAAKAAVQQAKLNVEYAAVISPISGRIGRSQVTEGALVSQTEATLLATVQQVDTMYVNFTQSAAEVMKLRRAVEAGKLQGSGATQVRVVLEDGTLYEHPAKLLFSDISVDATSGQVTLRAEVPNPKGELLPGLFVKVRIEQARSKP
jgi:membrane fusion protein (multidrug efflux system)